MDCPLLGLAQGFAEGRTVRVIAQHGWPVVVPVPCVRDEPIGHKSRLASPRPSRRAVGAVRQQKNERTPFPRSISTGL